MHDMMGSEGDDGDEFFVVCNGECECFIKPSKKKGDPFIFCNVQILKINKMN